MSGYCDYCLDDIEFVFQISTLACRHRFCSKCLKEFDKKNYFCCPFEECENEGKVCGKHGKQLGFYCEDEFLLICDRCFDDHRGHSIKRIETLESEISKELNKEITEGYKKLSELSEDSEKFLKSVKKSSNHIQAINNQYYRLTQKLDNCVKVNKILDLIQQGGTQTLFDWEKVNLPERVQMLKYYKNKQSLTSESSNLLEKLEKLSKTLNKLE